MTGCPAPEVLDAAARGELDPASRAALEQHVDGCPACAEVLAGLVHVYGSAMPSAPASGPVTVSDPGVAQAPSAPGPGATLGRFTIVRALGAGGMGVVYEAHDPSLQRRVALKLLHTDGAAHELRVQLLREARALARLAHPNVVGVHEVGEAGGRVFVAMEFIEGGTLRHWLRAGPTREAIVATFVAAGQGLAAAHAVGLVHRDFKPDNVLVGRDGRARVVDFGLARPLDASWATLGQTLVSGGTDGGLTTSVARTKPGSLVGTPAYMAPEQLRGERADAASDQFAFCVALYEALVGARPFAGSSLAMLATNVVEGRRPPTPSSVPSRLRAVLDRGLQPDPTRRFATMHALLRDLAPRKRGWVLPVAVTAGVLGAGVAAGVTWMVTRPDETQPPPVVVAPPSEPEADPVEPAPPTRAGLCGASLDATWSPGRRATVATALKGPLLQNGTSMRATAALDAWQEDFAAERDAACEDAAKKDRLPCLSRQWARFDALATALGDADSIAANYAEIAVSSLEPARACRSTARRALEPAAAADARARARRTLKRAAIDDAWARGLLHRVDAEDAAQRAVADVAESEDFVVMAEASRVLGDVLRMRGKQRAAEAAYKEALELATAAEHRGEVAAASLGLLHAVGVSQRRFDVLEPWDATVQANADALDEPRTRARLLQTRAALDRARMEYGDARTHLEALLEMREEDRGKTHVSLLSVRADLAELELLADNPAEALAHAEEAVRLAERTLVGKDLRHARVRGLLGRALLASAAPTEALVHLQASDEARIYPRPAAEERDAIVVGTAYAQALAAVGRHEEVAAAFEDAWQVWPNRRDNAAVRHAQGEWLLDQGKPEAGLAAHQAGLAAAVESVGSETGAWLTESLIALARGQLRVGQLEQAAATGTRAATVVETTPYGALWGPVYALRGDIARTRGDLETAMTLLDDAYVPLVGAYGVGHRQIDRNVLDRADVAWDLKKTDYAKRLYGNVVDNLEARLGAEHPDVVRARTRAAE